MSKQIWLLDLPDACRSGGLDVTTFDGWETRSRSSGGYDDLLGIGYHHDASPTTVSEANVDRYGWVNADAKPIGAMRLHRDGTLVVGAAGSTNTMGRGGPLTVSKGIIPKDRGNQTMIAIEAGNNGIGEPWSKTMVDAYVALVAALCKWYGLDPARDIFGHYDYVLPPPTTGRKIDPAGPTPSRPALGGVTGAKTWSLGGFRDAVKAWTPPQPPEPEPEPEPPGDDDVTDEDIERIADRAAFKVWETMLKNIPAGTQAPARDLLQGAYRDANTAAKSALTQPTK